MTDKLSTQYSADEVLHFIRHKKNDFWMRERERRALLVFHEAARRVPAYKDFLKKHRVAPEKIKTFKDFEQVPPMSKDSYLRKYPLEKLSLDGSLSRPLVWTSTSGSTGEPFYFPRGHQLDWESSVIHQLYLENGLRGSRAKGPTLVLVCFGMGVWIGGVLTYQAFEMIGRRTGRPISILTPGINKHEIFHALRSLAPHFAQTILVGYAPFVKDILDEASESGINLKKLHLRILNAAEAYTEKFRDYMVKKAVVENPYLDVMNIYGTADIGTMAYETPTSILARRLAMKSKRLFDDIFTPIQKTPTLAQYNPFFITFEASGEDILLTGSNTIPLVRYAIGDHGGVASFAEMTETFKRHGVDFPKAARRTLGAGNVLELPFVYVYERKDFSTTLYGLQIYPETIREVLIDKPHSAHLTGKFTLVTKFDRANNQYLEINLELKKNRKETKHLHGRTLKHIVANLHVKNSEFRELSHHLGDRALPKLVFWPAEHPRYFKLGVKQKWVEKNHD